MAVKTVSVALDTVITRDNPLQIVREGFRLGSVSVTDVPTGARMRLHLGKQDGFLVKGECTLAAGDAPEDSERGLFATNDTAQPGVAIELTVAYDTPPSSPFVV